MNKKNSFTVVVKNINEPVRLDKWLASLELENFEKISRTQVQNLVKKECVFVNKKLAKVSLSVCNEDVVEINFPELEKNLIQSSTRPLDIVYEDGDIIVVNKPAGLVVHPSAGHAHDTMVNALLNHTKQLSMKNQERPGIVHRIDKDTSGLLVVAKNDRAHELLSDQFKDKTAHRIYFAIAQQNKRTPKSGRIESIIARHPKDRKKYASLLKKNSSIGKRAITNYELIQNSSNYTLFKLKLETGRTHQIRVHLKELGNPIVGDVLYGFSKQTFEQMGLSRFYLHAAELGFVHPVSKEKMLFQANWPKEDLVQIHQWGFKYEFY